MRARQSSLLGVLLAAALGACGAGDGSPQETHVGYEARTPDGHIRFYLSERMAREGFATFCTSRDETDVDLQCDTFENYRINVLVQDGHSTLIFSHEQVESGASGHLRSFACTYRQDAPDCWISEH